jgi:hypothetical protein
MALETAPPEFMINIKPIKIESMASKLATRDLIIVERRR